MSSRLDQRLLVVDIESTCWEPPQSKPRNEVQEIIEVGIAEVDIKDLRIVRNDGLLVKPSHSKVSEFCTKLTTLTQDQVDKGLSYKEVCLKLENDYNSTNRTWASWGDFDRKQFQKDSELKRIKYPFGPRHINIKNLFSVLHGLDKELGLDAALKYLNMDLEGTHHRGVDDARNIANIFIHLLKRFRVGLD
jgi:inhibitor of KinA sporulation pathway (predicted exonuclease)